MRGLPATLYLAVAQDKATPETLAFHAWLRYGDSILTGAGGRERFTVATIRLKVIGQLPAGGTQVTFIDGLGNTGGSIPGGPASSL